MAEVVAFRNVISQNPVYGLPWVQEIPIFDADGDLVSSAADLDTELSFNGDTPTDATNEATEEGTSGVYYLVMPAAEMTHDRIAGVTKTSTSGAKSSVFTLIPEKRPVIRAGTAQGGDATHITLDVDASSQDDFYNGCPVVTDDGDARVITDYDGATKIALIHVAWEHNPDSSTTFQIIGASTNDVRGILASASDVADAVGTTAADEIAAAVAANADVIALFTAAVASIKGAGSHDIAYVAGLVAALNNLSSANVRAAVQDAIMQGTCNLQALVQYLITGMTTPPPGA
jgi:hypothetical protein